MKNAMKVLALILAISSTVQAIRAYAQENASVSIENEEYQLSRLMQLRQAMAVNSKTAPLTQSESAALSAEFPNIKTEDDFREEFSVHALRYIQALKGADVFNKVKKRAEFSELFEHDSPGV